MTKAESEAPVEYTKYEKARMIGSRALQISQGAPFLIKLSKKELEDIQYSPLEIAKKEFEAGVIPITVKRTYPNTIRKKEK
ncbi:DNA-directed RNA polymerase subunit K [Candidatus Woesearchaeota archaeon]|nr:DNA-directed RNA polymerase subunit K [Candidatus Woesearchaeota archaeon]